MNKLPLNENQVLARLAYFAADNVRADVIPVANACRWLTCGPDDGILTAHWSEILSRFTPLFKAAYPSGLHIPIPTPGSQGNIRGYMPGLIKALRLWDEAKTEVLGAPMKTEARPTALPTVVTSRSASRRLIGGTAGDRDLTDEDDSPLSAALPTITHTATPPAPQPGTDLKTYFPEVPVRPAKVTRQESAAPPLIDPTALESAERETADADALLATLLGLAPTQSNPGDPDLS
jgi:hypothetical protein